MFRVPCSVPRCSWLCTPLLISHSLFFSLFLHNGGDFRLGLEFSPLHALIRKLGLSPSGQPPSPASRAEPKHTNIDKTVTWKKNGLHTTQHKWQQHNQTCPVPTNGRERRLEPPSFLLTFHLSFALTTCPMWWCECVKTGLGPPWVFIGFLSACTSI